MDSERRATRCSIRKEHHCDLYSRPPLIVLGVTVTPAITWFRPNHGMASHPQCHGFTSNLWDIHLRRALYSIPFWAKLFLADRTRQLSRQAPTTIRMRGTFRQQIFSDVLWIPLRSILSGFHFLFFAVCFIV